MTSNSKKEDDFNNRDNNETVNEPLLEQLKIIDPNESKLKQDSDDYLGPEPKDKFSLVYCVVLLFGIATLLPWNIFITATDVKIE
jgi:hypothetical protein